MSSYLTFLSIFPLTTIELHNILIKVQVAGDGALGPHRPTHLFWQRTGRKSSYTHQGTSCR